MQHVVKYINGYRVIITCQVTMLYAYHEILHLFITKILWSRYIFKLYFIDYAITVVLIFHPWALPPSSPQSPRQCPHHCSCPRVMCISSLATTFLILYFTPPWLICNYLFVLPNPLTSSPILPNPPRLPQSGNHQNALHIHDPVSVLLVCLVWFFVSNLVSTIFRLLIDMYLLPFYSS